MAEKKVSKLAKDFSVALIATTNSMLAGQPVQGSLAWANTLVERAAIALTPKPKA